ncbi:MAG: amidase [Acidobacteria bacterium]|nr:amidase [Acidobacteriota bacterium]
MKKQKEVSTNESRRRFMAYFSSIGLGSTLVPGILWARMQDAGAQQINLEMLTNALKLSGVEFTEEERTAMVNTANQNLTRAAAMRSFHIPNDVSPPFHISAIVPGVVVNKIPQPFALSKAPALKVPGNLEDVAFWPVRHLSELLRTKQVSSVELTKMYLERLHRYNGQLLNTVTFLDELAMDQAKAADADLAAGRMRSPVHGIPWGCKDIITVKGYRTTWGSGAYKDQMFDYDASVVEMLREGGAVLIAKLTTGELAQGANWFGGMTRNPWNYGSSSGSSAGPGSATAAGCVGFAIGTETQGSILSPSGTNGVAGLRPTFGRISRHGAMTLGWTYDRLGPMCRYAEDCAMVLSVIAKPDGRDMSVADIPFNWNPSRYDLRKIRIGVVGLNGPNINPNAQKMIEVLKGLGATCIPLTIPNDNLPQVSEGFTYEQGAFFDELVRNGGVAKMTNPGRGNGFKSARLMNVVDYLQSQRIRMMMMMNLAKATAGIDIYFSAIAGGQRGGAGARGAAPGGAPPAPEAAAGAPGDARGGRGGRGGGGGGGGAATGNTNSAGYPGVNVVTSFSDPTPEAPVGTPNGIVLYAPPFKETELLFVAKSFQDAAQLHTRKPVLKT